LYKNALDKSPQGNETNPMPASVEKKTVTYTIQFPKSYSLRERLEEGYSTQNIHQDFFHPYLVGYSDNYGKYIKKKK
jgi:hypothetical protein